jgi:hypothetical protein
LLNVAAAIVKKITASLAERRRLFINRFLAQRRRQGRRGEVVILGLF